MLEAEADGPTGGDADGVCAVAPAILPGSGRKLNGWIHVSVCLWLTKNSRGTGFGRFRASSPNRSPSGSLPARPGLSSVCSLLELVVPFLPVRTSAGSLRRGNGRRACRTPMMNLHRSLGNLRFLIRRSFGRRPGMAQPAGPLSLPFPPATGQWQFRVFIPIGACGRGWCGVGLGVAAVLLYGLGLVGALWRLMPPYSYHPFQPPVAFQPSDALPGSRAALHGKKLREQQQEPSGW